MKREFHAILCGTSLLANFAKSDDAKGLDVTDWYRLDPDDAKQSKIEQLSYRGNEIFDKVYDYLASNPKEASAELNSFFSFCESYYAEREALLYCTDTGSGWFAAKVIYEYLKDMASKDKSYPRMVSEPQRLRYFRSSHTFDDGLIDIVERLCKIIIKKKEQGFRVNINATGGFKAESTYAVIASLLAGADSIYYKFETFRDLIILPAIPLRSRHRE